MKNPFKDAWGETNEFGIVSIVIVTTAIVIALIVAAVAGGEYWVQSSKCEQIHSLMGVDTHVSYTTGCLVKYKGEWMDADVALTNKREIEIK